MFETDTNVDMNRMHVIIYFTRHLVETKGVHWEWVPRDTRFRSFVDRYDNDLDKDHNV